MNPSEIEYLSRLPSSNKGDFRRGEIELITDAADIAKLSNDPSGLRSAAGGIGKVGIVYEDRYILVVRDLVRFPNGKIGTYLRIFERAALDGALGVVVLPLRDKRILMREVFRHATRNWELELPRGMRNAGTTDGESVEIELAQELGMLATGIERLGEVSGNTGLLAGLAALYLAHVGDGDASPRPEESEAFGKIRAFSVDEADRAVASGRIRDGFTISALYLAKVQYRL